MPLPLPPVPNAPELLECLRSLLATTATDSYDEDNQYIQMAAEGNAEDLLDAWDRAEGRATRIDDMAVLSIPRFVARLQRVRTDSEIEELVALLGQRDKQLALEIIASVSPIIADSRLEAILASKRGDVIEGLMRNVQDENQAMRLFDWVLSHEEDEDVVGEYSDTLPMLLKRFPALMTPDLAGRLTKACVTDLHGDWALELMRPLLMADLLDESMLLSTVPWLKDKWQQALITHPRATPALWVSIATQPEAQPPEDRKRQAESLKALMNHPPAMIVPEVVEALLSPNVDRILRSPAAGDSVVYLLRRVSIDLVPRVLRYLAAVDSARAMTAIEKMPAERRRAIGNEQITDILSTVAATHIDGKVRQKAILFSTPVGEDVRQPVARGNATRGARSGSSRP